MYLITAFEVGGGGVEVAGGSRQIFYTEFKASLFCVASSRQARTLCENLEKPNKQKIRRQLCSG